MTEKVEYNTSTSLTTEIADVLRERILTGRYEIGEQIKEHDVVKELSVSRTPVREAFKLLETEGLIDYIPNRGCFAKGFTKQDVCDIYDVRMALEELVIRRATERITEEEKKLLDEQCDLMEVYTKAHDCKRVMELNTSFHAVIYDAARSRFLAQVLRSYKEYIDKTRKYIFYEQSFLDSILQEHRKISEAIKGGNVDMAIAAMKEHLAASQDRAEFVWNMSK